MTRTPVGFGTGAGAGDAEEDGELRQVCWAPLSDGTGVPVNICVRQAKPGESQNNWLVRYGHEQKLDDFTVPPPSRSICTGWSYFLSAP